MLAAFLLSLSCVAAPVDASTPAHNECQQFELQRWDGPLVEDLETCATMAEALRLMGKVSTCELVPMDDAKPAAGTSPKPPVPRYTF